MSLYNKRRTKIGPPDPAGTAADTPTPSSQLTTADSSTGMLAAPYSVIAGSVANPSGAALHSVRLSEPHHTSNTSTLCPATTTTSSPAPNVTFGHDVPSLTNALLATGAAPTVSATATTLTTSVYASSLSTSASIPGAAPVSASPSSLLYQGRSRSFGHSGVTAMHRGLTSGLAHRYHATGGSKSNSNKGRINDSPRANDAKNDTSIGVSTATHDDSRADTHPYMPSGGVSAASTGGNVTTIGTWRRTRGKVAPQAPNTPTAASDTYRDSHTASSSSESLSQSGLQSLASNTGPPLSSSGSQSEAYYVTRLGERLPPGPLSAAAARREQEEQGLRLGAAAYVAATLQSNSNSNVGMKSDSEQQLCDGDQDEFSWDSAPLGLAFEQFSGRSNAVRAHSTAIAAVSTSHAETVTEITVKIESSLDATESGAETEADAAVLPRIKRPTFGSQLDTTAHRTADAALNASSQSSASVQSKYHDFAPLPLTASKWALPLQFTTALAARGVTHLYPWQAACLSLPGVLEVKPQTHRTTAAKQKHGPGPATLRNVVVSVSTSGGKTLVAAIIALRRLLEPAPLPSPGLCADPHGRSATSRPNGKSPVRSHSLSHSHRVVLYLVPLVALAAATAAELSTLLAPLGLRVASAAGNTVALASNSGANASAQGGGGASALDTGAAGGAGAGVGAASTAAAAAGADVLVLTYEKATALIWHLTASARTKAKTTTRATPTVSQAATGSQSGAAGAASEADVELEFEPPAIAIPLVVVDEAHAVTDENGRGAALEALITAMHAAQGGASYMRGLGTHAGDHGAGSQSAAVSKTATLAPVLPRTQMVLMSATMPSTSTRSTTESATTNPRRTQVTVGRGVFGRWLRGAVQWPPAWAPVRDTGMPGTHTLTAGNETSTSRNRNHVESASDGDDNDDDDELVAALRGSLEQPLRPVPLEIAIYTPDRQPPLLPQEIDQSLPQLPSPLRSQSKTQSPVKNRANNNGPSGMPGGNLGNLQACSGYDGGALRVVATDTGHGWVRTASNSDNSNALHNGTATVMSPTTLAVRPSVAASLFRDEFFGPAIRQGGARRSGALLPLCAAAVALAGRAVGVPVAGADAASMSAGVSANMKTENMLDNDKDDDDEDDFADNNSNSTSSISRDVSLDRKMTSRANAPAARASATAHPNTSANTLADADTRASTSTDTKTKSSGGGVIVFLPTRDRTEQTALSLAFQSAHLTNPNSKSQAAVAQSQSALVRNQTELIQSLAAFKLAQTQSAVEVRKSQLTPGSVYKTASKPAAATTLSKSLTEALQSPTMTAGTSVPANNSRRSSANHPASSTTQTELQRLLELLRQHSRLL